MANPLRGGEYIFPNIPNNNQYPPPPSSYQSIAYDRNPRNSIFSQNNGEQYFSHRNGRLYRPLPQQSSSQIFLPPSASASQINDPDNFYNNNNNNIAQPGLENPFVLAVLIAGLIGITLSIIIILSIWILRNANNKKGRKRRPSQTSFTKDIKSIEEGQGDVDEDEKNNEIKPSRNKNSHNNETHAELISELKQQQQQQASQDKDSAKEPKTNTKGNILSRKNKRSNNSSSIANNGCQTNIIENKHAEDSPEIPELKRPPQSPAVVPSSNNIIRDDTRQNKDSKTTNESSMPTRVLKETFV